MTRLWAALRLADASRRIRRDGGAAAIRRPAARKIAPSGLTCRCAPVAACGPAVAAAARWSDGTCARLDEDRAGNRGARAGAVDPRVDLNGREIQSKRVRVRYVTTS